MRKSMFWLTIAALIVLPMEGAVTVPDNTQVRNELSSYFGRIAENSPTVLGGLAKSPDTMNAIQKRIASMTDAELSKFGALMAQTPDWKLAPEALAGAFPPEMLDQIRRVAKNHAANVPNGEAMRDDVLSLVAVLKKGANDDEIRDALQKYVDDYNPSAASTDESSESAAEPSTAGHPEGTSGSSRVVQ